MTVGSIPALKFYFFAKTCCPKLLGVCMPTVDMMMILTIHAAPKDFGPTQLLKKVH